MKITRRKFLEAAPVIAGAVAVASGQSRVWMPDAKSVDSLAQMNFLSFHEFKYTEFIFRGPDGEVPLKLYDVVDSRPPTRRRWGAGEENFMLKFEGHTRLPLRQGTYEVEHFRMGNFSLFITEGGKVKDTLRYIAVINRITR